METIKKEVKTVQKKGNVQNGKPAKVNASAEKVATPGKVEKAKTETIEKETLKMIQNFRPSAEERIKNAEKFKILTEKYDHLKVKKEELEKFKISSDGTKEKIYFENAEGYKLEVSNSNIIDKMLSLAEDTLNEILNKTEKQVQEFVI
jgi:hypothetical protein